MGFRFRKSINLGGFRINLSKSGIGYSFGVKGFRLTRKAGGGVRTTIGVPNTGLSYVKERPAQKKKRKFVAKKEYSLAPVEEEIKDEIIESSSHEMIERLNRADKLDHLFRACRILLPVIGFILFSIFYTIVSNDMKLSLKTGEMIDGTAGAVVCGVLAAVFWGAGLFFILQKVKIDLFYDFSEDARFEREYSDFMKDFSVFQTTKKIWESRDDVSRQKAEISFVPFEAYINTDLDIKEIKLLRKKYCFCQTLLRSNNKMVGWVFHIQKSRFSFVINRQKKRKCLMMRL